MGAVTATMDPNPIREKVEEMIQKNLGDLLMSLGDRPDQQLLTILKASVSTGGVTCVVHDTCTDREGSNLCSAPPEAQVPASTDSTPEIPTGYIVEPDEGSL